MNLFGSSKRDAEIKEALEASRDAVVQEREETEKRLLAEAAIREALGDEDTAAHLRETVEYGRKITDRYRRL